MPDLDLLRDDGGDRIGDDLDRRSGGSGALFSRANSTSVTACERGRLPTWRGQDAITRCAALQCASDAERVVVVVIPAQPALELAMRVAAVLFVDLGARPDDRCVNSQIMPLGSSAYTEWQ